MSLDLFDLGGKTAIVTGSGRGLGRAIALGFADAGARVVTSARTIGEAEETAAEIGRQGGQAVARRADVTSRDDCAALVALAVERFGRLDIMACNAGVSINKPALETTAAEWDGIMAINLTGCFNSAQAAARQMIAQGRGGAIVVTSSNASMVGFTGLSAYCATKGGVDMLVRSLAIEWAPHGIRVNAINPGWMAHVMRNVEGERDDPRVKDEIEKQTPLARVGRDEEVVWPALFLASAAASFITGVALPVDGGYRAM